MASIYKSEPVEPSFRQFCIQCQNGQNLFWYKFPEFGVRRRSGYFFFSLFCSDRICNVRLIQLRCANKLILSCKKYDTINNIGNNTGIKSEHIKRVWWKMLRRKVCDACACNGGPLCDDTNKSMAEYRSKIKTEETKTKVNHYCNWLRMVWRVWRRCRMKNTHLRAFYRFSSL